jgi:uncharacterized protein
VYPEYCAGNIQEKLLSEMAFSEHQERFGRMKEGGLPQSCRTCEYEFACFGGCPKDRIIKTPAGDPGLNYLCSGWKRFFSHIDQPVQRIVRGLGETVAKDVRTLAAEHWTPEKQT